MEPISTGSDARFNFQVGKMKISEGIKHLQDLVEWCKSNSSLENDGILHDTMTYLRSLHPQIQEIERVAQQGGAAPASFNVHGTDLQREPVVSNSYVNEQGIAQIRKQNISFGSTLNQEIDVVTNKKRKTWSDVWNHFARYENKDKKMKAKCQYCNKDFDGSSKSGTTHLRNHLKSCLKNQNRVADKMKELNLVDQELHDFDFVQKIIKRLNNIKDDTFEVYREEKKKLHRYLNKLSGRFNVTIGNDIGDSSAGIVKIWFIDDKWKLKMRIIHLGSYDCDEERIDEDSLKCLIEYWNIDKRILSMVDQRINSSEDMVAQLTNWLNERVSLPVIGNYKTYLLRRFESSVEDVALGSDIVSKVKKLRNYYRTSSNKCKFDLAVKQVESMGKKVTSKYNDDCYLYNFTLLDWAMGYKEVFCELKRIDPDFTSSNFDWDDATSLHSFWVVVEDIKNDLRKLLDDSKLANERFPMVYHLFSKMLQFKNTENQYFLLAALRCREIFDEYCNNMVTAIPVILDPRFKLDIVEHFYNEVYENEGDLHFKKIMDDVTNIYYEYARDVNNSSMVRANANEAASSKSEFDRYLIDFKVPPHEDFDILEWWHVNSSTYPTLATMARDFLSIPIFYSPNMCFEDDFSDIYNSMDFDVGLRNALAYTKVWLNDYDCL